MHASLFLVVGFFVRQNEHVYLVRFLAVLDRRAKAFCLFYVRSKVLFVDDVNCFKSTVALNPVARHLCCLFTVTATVRRSRAAPRQRSLVVCGAASIDTEHPICAT